MEKIKWRLRDQFIPLAAILLSCGIGQAASPTPARLFFSDAKLSFTVPEPWDVASSFPYGPLLTRKTPEGTEAVIVCQISNPVDPTRLSMDSSTEAIHAFATGDVKSRPGARILAAGPRNVMGRNAYEVTFIDEGSEGPAQYQSVYFYMENRFYVLSLRANRDSFAWIVQDFQTWLTTVLPLSRQGSGQLTVPSHGGLWIHQTGGAKIAFPEEWLVGVADDHQVGATIARDKMHLAFTAGVDVYAPSLVFESKEKDQARHMLDKKGYKIVAVSEEPFHGYPSFQMTYEGTDDGRFVRGQDLWVSSPKARWLLSLEGDARLIRQLAEQWQGILNGIHFYP